MKLSIYTYSIIINKKKIILLLDFTAQMNKQFKIPNIYTHTKKTTKKTFTFKCDITLLKQKNKKLTNRMIIVQILIIKKT